MIPGLVFIFNTLFCPYAHFGNRLRLFIFNEVLCDVKTGSYMEILHDGKSVVFKTLEFGIFPFSFSWLISLTILFTLLSSYLKEGFSSSASHFYYF